MNKASFLTLVRQASRISDQDVEELEKLVVNFPYCQTAHLLIAKAAYDKGSMLSNQKLKKAAIYAANRQLLKKLIYTSDATVSLQPVENQETVAETPEKVITQETTIPAAPALPEPEILEEVETHEVELDADITGIEALNEAAIEPQQEAPESTEPLTSELTEQEKAETEGEKILAEANDILTQAIELTAAGAIYEDAAIAEEILEEGRLPETEAEFLGEVAEQEKQTISELLSVETTPVYEEEVAETVGFEPEKLPETSEEITLISEEEETVDETTEKVVTQETTIPEAPALPEPEISSGEAEISETVASEQEKVEEQTSEAAHILEDVPDVHELFLENAPEAIHEISEPTPEETTISEPEQTAFLNDELLHETLASFDQYLFKPEKEQETEEIAEPADNLKVVYPQDEIQHIYDADSLGYWMNSSRLGESLEIKNEFTHPQPYDFYPELIWEYSKTHELRKEIKPAPSKLSKQVEIIDEFLKMTPRLKTMGNAKIKTEPQEDLSSKSSKINKNLASENFANILVKQGKIKKAIKIYEHLILKIPEKKPYFVAQIEKLQNME